MGSDKTKAGVKEKWITFGVMAGITVFFCGHLAAIIERGADLDSWSAMLLEHIRTEPLDMFHVNGYVLYFAACIYTLIFFMVLSKRELPRAEMKGMEHGSNDFQTDVERNTFLANNTTPVYSLDLHEFREVMLKPDESKKEKKQKNKGSYFDGKCGKGLRNDENEKEEMDARQSAGKNREGEQPAVKPKCENQL